MEKKAEKIDKDGDRMCLVSNAHIPDQYAWDREMKYLSSPSPVRIRIDSYS